LIIDKKAILQTGKRLARLVELRNQGGYSNSISFVVFGCIWLYLAVDRNDAICLWGVPGQTELHHRPSPGSVEDMSQLLKRRFFEQIKVHYCPVKLNGESL